jgi:hypothetical protein
MRERIAEPEVRIHSPPAESRFQTRFLQRRVRGLLFAARQDRLLADAELARQVDCLAARDTPAPALAFAVAAAIWSSCRSGMASYLPRCASKNCAISVNASLVSGALGSKRYWAWDSPSNTWRTASTPACRSLR